MEQVSLPYEFSVELVSISAGVDLAGLLGTPALLSILDRSGGERLVHGLIREMEQLHTANRWSGRSPRSRRGQAPGRCLMVERWRNLCLQRPQVMVQVMKVEQPCGKFQIIRPPGCIWKYLFQSVKKINFRANTRD
jgi:hypothetical protein